MPGCSAFGCSNRTEDGFCLKVFPRNPVRRAIWATKVNRKNWIPKDTSYLCEKHFEKDQWEVARVDGKKKLKANAIPTIFREPGKRKAKGGPGRRHKELKTDDEEVIEYIESLETMKCPPECVVCCRPLVDDKKEYLSTLTTTTGLSLHQCLLDISHGQSSKIERCTTSDLVCYYCAHLINYADKIEAELANLKAAINGCLQIKSMSEDDQVALKPEFDSHIEFLDEYSERVVGPGSAASRNAELCEFQNSDNGTTDTVTEDVVTALGNHEFSQVEGGGGKSVWQNNIKGRAGEGQVPQASAPPEVDLPVLKCKICQLKTTSHAVLLFHLRRHMANYQWCDFCDTPIFDENEISELNEHSAAKL